jgi:hypothetical protein
VFSAWITKNGKRIHSKRYGLKAWPIEVPRTDNLRTFFVENQNQNNSAMQGFLDGF